MLVFLFSIVFTCISASFVLSQLHMIHSKIDAPLQKTIILLFNLREV